MANFNPTIITDSGLSLIAKISSGSGQMSFTRICTSKSSYSVDEAQHLSALTTIEQETTIDKVEIINDTAVKVSAVITNKLLESGYYINAIGLYAEDPDLGEILYSITIAKVPDWMQPDSGSGVSSLLIQLITQVSNSSNIKTELNPSVLATVQDLLDHANNADMHVTAEEKASWNGKAELTDIPTTLPANGGNAAAVRTSGEDGTPYGDSYLMTAQYNKSGDNTFRIFVTPVEGNVVWVSVDRADHAIDSDTLDGKHASDFLQKVNGTLSEPLKWNDASLPSQTGEMQFLLGIDSFAEGGTTRWKSAADITVGNAASVGGATLTTNAGTVGLHRISSGTAAATTDNCPVGCWYGKHD